ncbi:hypothetical protein Dvina_20145 [Dactylosporangium vinaceum]|uniref:Uncharacterized protein n=1 Tax=Dactylosporangium vinaceum TaxID=53362 RepID=A0ABV5MSC9_9ACTN|nr:hypothetical protein [Dactylosporangium vinaceum]UAC00164.1 hypothetical protein Dvina_20145 [Dactylosporangium vinaceum]
MSKAALATRIDQALLPDPRRVIVKLFMPGEDAVLVDRRIHALVDRVADLIAAMTPTRAPVRT